MLSEIIKVSENSDVGFVGLKFVDGLPTVIFPRGYELANDEKQIRKDIIKLIATIQKFSGHYEGESIKNKIGENDLSMPITSYQYVIYDFIAHGYYTEKEVHYVENAHGKINWKRTIQKVQPQTNNSNVVYLKFITKTNQINDNNLITKIHEYCVHESFDKIGWLFFEKDAKPKKPTIKFNKRMFLSVLKEELGNTFNDSKRQLFQAMINIVNNANETTDKKINAVFGVNRFEYVWEHMFDHVFGEDSKDIYFPHAKWHIVTEKGYNVESSALEPDTIMLNDGSCYILDAKYYKYGITRSANHLPSSSSIEKQIVYGEYIDENDMFEFDDKHIYNAFIMPFNARQWKCEEPYKFVSVGTADWKPAESDKNYDYVLGILMDTRYIIDTYTKHNSSEIVKLANLIDESLDNYLKR